MCGINLQFFLAVKLLEMIKMQIIISIIYILYRLFQTIIFLLIGSYSVYENCVLIFELRKEIF